MDENGCSWRSGAKVEKRPLRQWFLRATNLSQDLSEGLDDPSLINWRDITSIQKKWIGDCTGTKLKFGLTGSAAGDKGKGKELQVWTDQAECVYGAKFIGISPEHILAREDLVKRGLFEVPPKDCQKC